MHVAQLAASSVSATSAGAALPLYLTDNPCAGFAAATALCGVITFCYDGLRRRLAACLRSPADAYEDGYEAGYDKGWRDAQSPTRLTVIDGRK